MGINENNLFKHIKEIKSSVDFRNTQITNLGNLQTIGGKAYVDLSQDILMDELAEKNFTIEIKS